MLPARPDKEDSWDRKVRARSRLTRRRFNSLEFDNIYKKKELLLKSNLAGSMKGRSLLTQALGCHFESLQMPPTKRSQ